MNSLQVGCSRKSLSVRRLKYSDSSLPPLVLLHGWGADSRVWNDALEYFPEREVYTVDLPGFGDSGPLNSSCFDQRTTQFEAAVLALLPPRFVVVGWSLGGMLATQLAARNPDRVVSLVTLATNVSYTQRNGWSGAMPVETFDQFRDGFSKAPEQTLKRFSGLMASGDMQAKGLIKRARQLSGDSYSAAGHEREEWLVSLDWLDSVDNRELLSSISVPSLHILGSEDVLVPSAISSELEAILPPDAVHNVMILEGCSHILHQHSATWMAINGFLDSLTVENSQLDKRKIAESFSRAAPNYDSVAGLQRDIADQLKNLAPKDTKGLWLDLGSGTGYVEPWLSERADSYIGLDLAQGMLEFSRSKGKESSSWVAADAELMPFRNDCIDGLFSSLAIQWCSDLERLFSDIYRVLKPGGTAVVSTLGPRTLGELGCAWSAVDDYVHVNQFENLSHLQAAINSSGLIVEQLKTEDRVLRYQELKQLTYELKTLGAHNMNSGQANGLTSKSKVSAFKAAYEAMRTSEGWLPATYEVFYIRLSKPENSTVL